MSAGGVRGRRWMPLLRRGRPVPGGRPGPGEPPSSGRWHRRGLPRPRRRRFPRPGRRLLLAVALIVALLALGWLWLRDSSLVAVKRVTVTGASGPDATEIRSALVTAAR